jgi:hypothetical protein
VTAGPLTVWYSGPTDPSPMLREQAEAARSRFRSIVGTTPVEQAPLRIFCFHDRGAFERFHARIGFGEAMRRHDGIFFQRPYGMLTLCAAEGPYRLTDPAATVRSLFGFELMQEVFGSFPAPWIQLGLNKALSRHGEVSDRIRLNRKMIAALARGTARSDDLFRVTAKHIARWLRRPNDTGLFQQFEQFSEQSASMIEYLCGDRAPEERKAAFRDFVMDRTSVGRLEESFFRRFGFGFGSLLDSWREWVLEQGTGPHEPPRPEVRDGLLYRLLPAIGDARTRRGDRILAVREWARAGAVLGADILIGQLREGGGIPKEEIVWALSMVSGMALGNETDRWQAWWDGLPIALREPQPDGVEMQSPARSSEV